MLKLKRILRRKESNLHYPAYETSNLPLVYPAINLLPATSLSFSVFDLATTKVKGIAGGYNFKMKKIIADKIRSSR